METILTLRTTRLVPSTVSLTDFRWKLHDTVIQKSKPCQMSSYLSEQLGREHPQGPGRLALVRRPRRHFECFSGKKILPLVQYFLTSLDNTVQQCANRHRLLSGNPDVVVVLQPQNFGQVVGGQPRAIATNQNYAFVRLYVNKPTCCQILNPVPPSHLSSPPPISSPTLSGLTSSLPMGRTHIVYMSKCF